MAESRLAEWVAYNPRRNGMTTVDIRCPFCDCVVQARTWSLAGSGKRCECGAVFSGLVGGVGHRALTAHKEG
ncbi:MAG: hypothetical protein QM628_00405 [Propionicimonas sp.]